MSTFALALFLILPPRLALVLAVLVVLPMSLTLWSFRRLSQHALQHSADDADPRPPLQQWLDPARYAPDAKPWLWRVRFFTGCSAFGLLTTMLLAVFGAV